MAYPMIKAITFRELKERLADKFECRFKKVEEPVRNTTDGSQYEVSYLERDVPGGKAPVQCVVTLDEDERILPTQLRQICARLHIDPAEFGLHLG